MFQGQRVTVVIPARDEYARIGRVLAGLPPFVDDAIVIDDASQDGTAEAARHAADPRVQIVTHGENRGVGAAIVTGYLRAVERGADVVVVMAGDDQMDPADMPRLVTPLVAGTADYVKGNRFLHPDVRRMPRARRLAGKALAAATRRATGLTIDDSQCGYTAITRAAILGLPLSDLWPRYGYPNDLLVLLAERGYRVAEVPVRPIYAGEGSGVRPWHALVVLGLLARRVLARAAQDPMARSIISSAQRSA